MRFLPINVHNILDYIVGLALILAPNIFGFSDVGGAAVWVPRVIGIVSILMGLMTQGYSYKIAGLIPLRLHLWADVAAGIVLALSPWLFGFSDEKSNAWVPHLVVGIALVLVGLVTKTSVDSRRKVEA